MKPDHPSKKFTVVPVSGRYNEFPAYTTSPQQDHRPEGNAVKIAAPIDNRATPWNAVTRANLHQVKTTALPPANAKKAECREWIYHVLSYEKWSNIPDKYPQEVNVVINTWHGNGKKLRSMVQMAHGTICPPSWTSVYGDIYQITDSHRHQIERRLKNEVARLLIIEREEAKKQAKLLKEKEGENKGESKVRTFWLKLLCAKKTDAYDSDNESVDTLPLYTETA